MNEELQSIPGVGRKMAARLQSLGYQTVSALRGADAQDLYARDCAVNGAPLDRCVLYVYRCAIYYAENDQPEPKKCCWWFWKDDHQ